MASPSEVASSSSPLSHSRLRGGDSESSVKQIENENSDEESRGGESNKRTKKLN